MTSFVAVRSPAAKELTDRRNLLVFPLNRHMLISPLGAVVEFITTFDGWTMSRSVVWDGCEPKPGRLIHNKFPVWEGGRLLVIVDGWHSSLPQFLVVANEDWEVSNLFFVHRPGIHSGIGPATPFKQWSTLWGQD